MDVIREFFDEHNVELKEKLRFAGFSAHQARDFLPEAVESILSSTQNTGIAHAISGLLDDPRLLLDSVNTDAIATKLNMQPKQVAKGFDVIAPVLSQAFLQKKIARVESIGGGSVADFMSSARKLFS